MVLNGKKIKQLRKDKKMSLLDLSAESGVNMELLSKIENGRRAGTSLNTANKLATFFNLTIDELIIK